MASIDKFTGAAGTGRDLALALERRFQGKDWVADLAGRANQSRDFVEWHLQEDMAPPAEIIAAAREMLDDGSSPSEDDAQSPGANTGLTSPDDLPFAGLPGNLGKLRKD
jgi:hypothetical protein